jgi:hypothetical protein
VGLLLVEVCTLTMADVPLVLVNGIHQGKQCIVVASDATVKPQLRLITAKKNL